MTSGLRPAFLILLFLAGGIARAQYTIRWLTDPASTAVEVEGIPRDAIEALQEADASTVVWSQLLAVYAEQPVDPGSPMPGMPPLAGAWKLTKGRLRFEPRFPLMRGVAYRAEFWPSRLPGPLGSPALLLGPIGGMQTGPVISFFELPRDKAAPSTSVMQIYPTADVLPENQLKFYVHFSAPMSRGGIGPYVQLRGADGRPLPLPFLELDEESWDPTMTRLTLMIEPGRRKRGVTPQEDDGPVFAEGKSYTLAINPAWRDATGQPLRLGFEKTFRVGPADRTPPDPARWKLTLVPPANSQAPLIVQFDEPLERALALRLINVRRVVAGNARLAPIDGEIMLDDHERRWMLAPVAPWPPGQYRLIVAGSIEDLAGNNIGRTFDETRAAEAQRQLAAPNVSVPFEIK